MANPKACGSACQFIKPDYSTAEHRIHGRPRQLDSSPNPSANGDDEIFFGVTQNIYQARLEPAKHNAQWTGITTELAADLLRSGKVDAVLTMAPAPDDRWRPEPVLVTDPEMLAYCRGMRMGYAPLLALLEPAIEQGYRKLAVIGIPCQVYALRALEQELGLEALYVIGTPCSDNTTTENFHQFLALLTDRPDSVSYLEFRADYHVEMRFDDGEQRDIPFLALPISDLPEDFFPLTCRTCVDYTNSLADITVGYMGGNGDQWLLVRNERGREILEGCESDIVLSAPISKGDRFKAVDGFRQNTERAAGGLPLRRMPNWIRPIISWLMPRIGPKGLEFARSRVEMKAIETVLHLRRQEPAKMKNMIPDHVRQLAARYGVKIDVSEP